MNGNISKHPAPWQHRENGTEEYRQFLRDKRFRPQPKAASEPEPASLPQPQAAAPQRPAPEVDVPADVVPSFQRSRSAPVDQAQRRELPKTLLRLEPKPLSAYDENPVFDEITAARFLGLTAGCLKKWRQRRQGPDYIQYGNNGPVRYELNALKEFRETHRVRMESS